MAFAYSSSNTISIPLNSHFKHTTIPPLSISFHNSNPRKPKSSSLQFTCLAAKQSTNPVNKKRKKKPSSDYNNNNKTSTSSSSKKKSDVYKGFGVNEFVVEDEGEDEEEEAAAAAAAYQSMPKPPAGFVVDEQGKVLMVANKRIVSIVDSTNNFPLDCVVRRVFKSSRGDDCLLLCPVDMPVQIMKSTNFEGWSAVSDEEVEALLPTAAYALAKIHMHLIHSGFCYTARGGFCYTEDNIFEFGTDDGEDVDGLPNEGVEITFFHLDGSHYMIYTPSDPLLFVATKDQDGRLQIADDELLEDPATISAIDEETEFNALVEEEAALLESLFGER
ncbi:BTB/POZ domain protein TNFAIP protein [Heracleum sosnowskyi]|uniref:BTB/POZ domain protein TNFAIP protein n=1 Tax=Heracleum sosnowskyi TaxID=360622 RepID=A0AAD8HIZ7_9APIA|nr:BTB/POZ domain protein TNFAIP protein [Heracleum sosnowskyi]